MSKYDDLVKKLKEIFQIDKPELDFGVYRILNARSAEITEYLENRLKAKVLESLSQAGSANVENLKHDLAEAEKNATSLGVSPDSVPKVKELRQKIAGYGADSSEHENAVFSHLLTFFSRYYDNGDFISQRRYKGDSYSIPYAGEEVFMYWANKDQYYTKSGESFSNYGFKLEDGRVVKFRLVAADTSKDNRKDSDKERRFVLIEQHEKLLIDDNGEQKYETIKPVEVVDGELVIRFEYKVMPRGTKQEVITSEDAKKILAVELIRNDWQDLANKEPTEGNPNRTLLEKTLINYTSKNTADYFIHKNLGGFLRGELDFYIKNEVMYLDDIQNVESTLEIQKILRLIQTLRTIALDLISFLAQLEDFQKKLWLKKKFVVSTNYCITLDRVPASLYADIAANDQQWDRWNELGILNHNSVDLLNNARIKSEEYLKENLYLVLDTELFDLDFKSKLLKSLDNLDSQLDGLLIHSDNFQALNLLQDRYREEVQAVYIDPPYNTNATEIIYKNGYKQSSWMTLISSRLSLAKNILKNDGAIAVTIDDYEVSKLSELLDQNFGEDNRLGNVAIRINPKGRMTSRKVSLTHEYALFYGVSEQSSIKKLPVAPEEKTHNYKQDTDGSWFLPVNLRKQGVDSDAKRSDGSYLDRYYPIYLDPETGRVSSLEELPIKILPIDSSGLERIWRRGKADIDRMYEIGDIWCSKTKDAYQVYYKFRGGLDGKMVQSLWTDSKYSASDHGTRILDDILGARELFSYPKSPYAVEDTILAMTDDKNAIVCDFFAGSGTTGQAVISLNRNDKDLGKRKYILVEQGEYFDKVTKPRIQKIIYSENWKDGKPVSPFKHVSHAFKTLKLESYEDSLNNIHLKSNDKQRDLMNLMSEEVKDDYLLKYMLKIESNGSILSVDDFRNPFDFKLNISIDSAGAYKQQRVDLVETFNYLLGLRVANIDTNIDKGFISVTGHMQNNEKVLILWRDVGKINYDSLSRLCEKLAINPADSEFDIVYINGDHNIPSVFTATEAEGGITKTLKIRQIEPEFISRMFAVDNV